MHDAFHEDHAKGFPPMKDRTLPEVAKALSLSTDTLRYWVKLSGVMVEKKGRSVFISEEGFSQLSRMAALVVEGFPPAEAAKRASDTSVTVPVTFTEHPPAVDLSPVSGRLTLIEKAILAVCEQNNGLVQANRQLQEIVRQQSAELAAIRAENAAMRSDIGTVRGLLAAPPATEKATEKSFSDELANAVQEIKGFISGAFAPFVGLFRLG